MSDYTNLVQYPTRKTERIQPDSPVHIHAYSLTSDTQTGASYVQVRMVNRSDSEIESIFLRIRALDLLGQECYDLHCMPVAGVHAKAHSEFGDDRILLLPERRVATLEIEVEDILFHDGMIWRKQASHKLMPLSEAGWNRCSCGMYNPAEAICCALCGRSFVTEPETTEPLSPTSPIVEAAEAVFISSSVKPLTITEPLPEMPNNEATEPVSVPTILPPTEEEAPAEAKAADCSEDMAVPVEPLPVAEEMSTEEVEEIPETEAEDVPEEIPEDSPAALVANQSIEELMETLKERLALIEEYDRAAEQEQGEDSSASDRPEPTPQLMQETAAILQEMQRRMEERERQQNDPAALSKNSPEEEVPSQEADEQPREESEGHGIGFWIFLTILMLLLSAAAIAWVLYKKGYIG